MSWGRMPLRACLASVALLPWGSTALRSVAAGSSGSTGGVLPARRRARKSKRSPVDFGSAGHRDLVLMHIPFNFGHTVEKVAFLPATATMIDLFMYFRRSGGDFTSRRKVPWKVARRLEKPNGEVWGHVHPDLQVLNEKTGCDMYFSPQKYWPEDLAQSYFGNQTIFGMLRDPAERLVSMFRGNVDGYGGGWGKYFAQCDVNNGVKHALKEYIASGDKFHQDCTFLPQAEYFEGEYGIRLPIDNRKFPESMQEAFLAHGYDNMRIRPQDILHVTQCPQVWAGDLDNETRALIKEVYARDYKLLCKHFGYCDPSEDTCITGVEDMCPEAVLKAMGK